MPVDGESLIRRLAVLLIYQCMSVPTSGTTILSGHHSPHVNHWYVSILHANRSGDVQNDLCAMNDFLIIVIAGFFSCVALDFFVANRPMS